MKGTVHAQNAGHREREMNWIAIDIIGNVKGIYGSKKDADCRAYALMLITPDAEALALSIGNIRKTILMTNLYQHMPTSMQCNRLRQSNHLCVRKL